MRLASLVTRRTQDSTGQDISVRIDLKPGWNLISLPFQPPNPSINSVIPSNHPIDVVMTYDNATQAWLVAQRDKETGLFTGEIAVMTATAAYFVRTDSAESLTILRPPISSPRAAPESPIGIPVSEGWNLVPVVTHRLPLPRVIPADECFGTLGLGGWIKALSFDPVSGNWEPVMPQSRDVVKVGRGYWLYATRRGVIIP